MELSSRKAIETLAATRLAELPAHDELYATVKATGASRSRTKDLDAWDRSASL